MMHGSDKAGHFAGFYQVGRTCQTDGKGMELMPPGIFFIVGFYPFACIFLGNGRDDGTVQTAGKKYAVEMCIRDRNYYLASSRLVAYKKIDIIIEAFNRMPDKDRKSVV